MTRKYKIAMVGACPFPTFQGSQVFIKQLSEAMLHRGHEVHIVTYHFGEEIDNSLLTIHRIPRFIPYKKLRAGPSWRKPLLDVLLTSKLLQIVKRFGIDIIHSHNYEATLSGFAVRFFTGIPVLFHSHGVMVDELHTYFNSRISRYLARKGALFLDVIAARHADHIITVSPDSKPFFVSKALDESKVDYIPPGIFYHESGSKSAERIREIYNIGPRPMILYTGNLDKYQNLEFLLKSFSLALKDFPDAVLVILTHSETCYIEKFCKNFKIMNNVVLVENCGFNDVQVFLEESDLAVLPRTSWSGFPIKLLNYMAAGKAVIACEGSAKGIEHLKDGFIVKDNDTAGFARGIVTLISDSKLRRRLGDKAKQKVISHYSWDSISEDVEKLYQRMLCKRNLE